MNAKDYWQLFLDTGAPEAYLLYQRQLKMEANDVSQCQGHCAESNRIS